MQIDLAVLADAANVTADGKVNVVGIFRQIRPNELPIALPTFNVIISLTAEPADMGTSFHLEVTFKNLDGEALKPFVKGEFSIPNRVVYDYPMLNFIIGVQNFQIGIPGEYYFDILLNDHSIRRIPLLVAEPLNNNPKLLNQP